MVLFVTIALGAASGAIYWLNFDISGAVPVFSNMPALRLYVLIFMPLAILYLAGVLLVCRMPPDETRSRLLTGVIVLFALVFRICLIAPEPNVLSRDMYRYIWDGRVQHSGINPYLHPPAAGELEALRDEKIFPNINRKGHTTVYPAGAQLFFGALYAVSADSVTGFKAAMVLFDALTLLTLAGLLRIRGVNPSRLLIYAWNPLVIFEIAYSGHLEGVMVFLMTASLYLCASRKKTAAVFVLALAAAVKLYPALLLAAFVNREDAVKAAAVFAATVTLLYLPFVDVGPRVSGFLPVYLENPYESFNAGLKYLLMRLFPAIEYRFLSRLMIAALAVAALAVFLKRKNTARSIWYAYGLTGLLMVMMPASLHPWYVVMLVPFLTIYPNPAWLIFTCTVTLSYLKYTTTGGIMPVWVLTTEYLLLFVMLAAGFLLSRYRGRGAPALPGAQFKESRTMEMSS